MVAARNRLRILMGQKPIGITNPPRLRIPLSTRTTPRPSTPTRMETTRQRIVQNLILDQDQLIQDPLCSLVPGGVVVDGSVLPGERAGPSPISCQEQNSW